MIRGLTRLVADATLIAALLFTSAGTVAWWRAWVLLGVMLVIRTATAIAVHRVSPALLEERSKPPIHAGQPLSDRLLLLGVITTGFLALPVIAGLDVFRVHLLSRPGPLIAALGLALFSLGWTLKGLALRTNAFATSVVRLQRE